MNDDFSAWIDKQEVAHDRLDATRSNALRAALAQDASLREGDEMPVLHHWLHFWNVVPPGGLGADGHAARGKFLPPVPLPHRMWAGGRFEFIAPLKLGEAVTRTSTIISVTPKTGKSGELVFVTVKHEISGENGLAMVEEQDLVYRGGSTNTISAPGPDGPVPAAAWRETVEADSVLLFRYSALTMNSHRIHYDRSYTMNQEGYPALVVHGPLQATLLADLAVRKGGALRAFSFRGHAPAFDIAPLHVCGEPGPDNAELWTEQDGAMRMVATAAWGPDVS
ncbi:MAG TPA: MaoC family dehydratase N-terminal domain-containing protein [Novosphingobium sp.]|nr:MaoC family dehydratase N-terminal domain-containing protein [Novosphingobium sp.]